MYSLSLAFVSAYSYISLLTQDGADNRDRVKEWFLMSNADRRDKLLACGALIVAELRLEVLKETEFTCSAGIAHNKVRGSFLKFRKYKYFFLVQCMTSVFAQKMGSS